MKGLRFVTFSGRGYVLLAVREESSALTTSEPVWPSGKALGW